MFYVYLWDITIMKVIKNVIKVDNDNFLELKDISDIIYNIKTNMFFYKIDKTSDNFNVIIPGFERCKEYFDFRFINDNEPIIIRDKGITYNIYSDYYDFDKELTKENISNYLSEYNKSHIKLIRKEGTSITKICKIAIYYKCI
jgi:hypothetical protein